MGFPCVQGSTEGNRRNHFNSFRVRPVIENPPEKFRLAMIGIGHVAEHQLKALTSNPCWELVGASDLRSERRDLLFSQTPFFESAEELLGNVDADMVLVSTPNCTHFELGKIVLEAGKNLLLEKPCCETPEQLDELIHISNARGTLFNVALHASHARDLCWFIDNRDNLELGDITSFHCGFFDPYLINGMINPSAASLGGLWFDSGINALSVIGAMLPASQISLVEARITRVEIEGCSDIQATVELACATASKRCLGMVETNWTLGINRKTTRLFFCAHKLRSVA